MGLELTRQKIRQRALRQFKHLRTCALARELCFLVRTNRVAFNVKDVQDCCSFIAKLCEEAGCKEQADLCIRAAEAILKDESEYLKLCKESCRKCGKARRPERKTGYII